jgi:protein-L-isoaspartate(D-aspartate) O-methyltransferase
MGSGLIARLAFILRPIGFNATISAPHMHAHALEDLEEYIRPGMKVLDVGCGSGYRTLPFVRDAINDMLLTYCSSSPRPVTAVIHRMVSSSESNFKGQVIGIDHLPGLTALATRNLKSDGIEVGPGKGIEIVTGDGRKGSCSQSQRV